MEQYIDKAALAAEIDKGINGRNDWQLDEYRKGYHDALTMLKKYLFTLKVEEVHLNNSIQLTWKDIRDLYIIFAEVDAEIEFCKCDIQIETIGYYQEVLKRFKERKGG